jgi:hypothetical protein
MAAHPAGFLIRKVFTILTIFGFLGGTFAGSGIKPVHAQVPAEGTGVGLMAATPDFYVFLAKDSTLWDIHGYNWPLSIPVTMTLDNPPLTPGTPDFTRVAYMEVPSWGGGEQLVFDITGMSVVPGALVTMTDGLTADLTHTVPPLYVTGVDPDTDIVTGTTNAGGELWVTGDDWAGIRRETATVDGTWKADFSQPGDTAEELVADIIPGLKLHISQANGGGTTSIAWQVPNDQGVIMGTVYDLGGAAITDLAVDVTANFSNGSLSTCTDPFSGKYQITGLPLNDPITVSANENGGCDFNLYGWERWQHVTVRDVTPITLTSAAKIAGGINFSLGTSPRGVEFLYFNLDNPFLGDPAVRQVIAYGTDRQTILDQAWLPYGATGMVQESYLAEGQWGHVPDPVLTLHPYDPQLARNTLEAAGWIDSDSDGVREKDGQELSFIFKTTTQPRRQTAGALFVADMQAIGIQITATYLPMATFVAPEGVFFTKDFDIAEMGNSVCGSLEDTTCVPYAWFVTGNAKNVMGYSSAIADTLYANAQAAGSLEDRRYYAIQHQIRVSQDLPVLPLFWYIPGFIISGNAGVAGATLSYFDEVSRMVTADASGAYSLTVSPGWTGTVTPSRAGRSFSPAWRSYAGVLANLEAQDYVAGYALFLPLVVR